MISSVYKARSVQKSSQRNFLRDNSDEITGKSRKKLAERIKIDYIQDFTTNNQR